MLRALQSPFTPSIYTHIISQFLHLQTHTHTHKTHCESEMTNYRVCYCFIRKFKVTVAEPPLDIKEAFKKYSGDKMHMTSDQLRKFLEEYQGGGDQSVSISDTDRIVEQILHKRHHHLAKLIHRKSISLEDFHYFLFNTELNPPIRSQVYFHIY